MKKTLISLLALTLFSQAQDAPKAPADASAKREKPQYIVDLEALSTEENKKYYGHFLRADSLFKQKRIFECLEAIHELNKIYAGNPASLNLQGACYVEFRAFTKARLAFAKAVEVEGENFNVSFNVAEIDFVTKDYASALEKLTALKTQAEGNPRLSSMAAIIDFKILLCMLKTGDEAGARKMVADTDFLDDSPLFYYGNAALEYFADNGVEAETWLARAGRIFRDQNIIAPWQDTLIEFGYIKSFYGGDLEVESGLPAIAE